MQGKNKPLFRYLEKRLINLVSRNQSALILGPRQVGKTTLVKKSLFKIKNSIEYPLQNPAVRLELESKPGRLINQIEVFKIPPFVFIDEAQKVPSVFDSAQYLIDEHKARFIFTGSSARKLRRAGVNLLPGRIKRFFLDPLLWGELGLIKENTINEIKINNINKQINYSLGKSLVYGSLPGIVGLSEKEREDFLRPYSQIYLEEEIRAEAISRKIGAFSRFLELSANESGTSPNLTNLSNESGVSQPAIKEFYRVLEDTLIVEKVEPYLKNARKRILSFPRYYFFDIGVRNALCRLPFNEGLINVQKGKLFEHAVVLEIIRRVRVLNKNYKVNYWRTSGGAEVDCIIDMGNRIIPIEIKTSANITAGDIKGLKIFLEDYKNIASQGYVVSMEATKKEKITDNITLIPWNCI
jgi:uncharacterized protein